MRIQRRFVSLLAASAIIASIITPNMATMAAPYGTVENAKSKIAAVKATPVLKLYNEAYTAILELPAENQPDLLAELSTYWSKVYTPEVKSVLDKMDTLAEAKDLKNYTELETMINTEFKDDPLNNSYLLGELTNWGKGLVYTPEVTAAIDAINKAWGSKSAEDINSAKAASAKVSVAGSTEWLLGQIAEIEKSLSLSVNSVNPITNNRVDILLNSAITIVPAISNFIVKDANGSLVEIKGISLSQNGKTVKLITTEQKVGTIYTVTVEGKEYKYVAQLADTTIPKLTAVAPKNNTVVVLTFNTEVDENALNAANYSIPGLSVLKAQYVLNADNIEDKTNIILTTSAQEPGTVYKVGIKNVTNLGGNLIDPEFSSIQFNGLAPDTTKPQLISATAQSNTSVKVTFDKSMDKSTAEDTTYYAIAGLTILKAELAFNKTEVVLTTSSQKIGTTYKLVVVNLVDESGNIIDENHDDFKFIGMSADTTKPQLVSGIALNNTSISITYNEDMDKVTAENIANYSIKGLSISKAVLSGDKRTVILSTSPQTAGTVYKVIVQNVTDISKNTIDVQFNSFQFGGLAEDTSKPKISSAVSTSNTSVKLTFNEPINESTGILAYNYYFGSELGYATKASKDTVINDGTVWNLTTAPQDNKIYQLQVRDVQDLSGNLIDKDNDTVKFIGTGLVDTTVPKVKAAAAYDNKTVVVTFDKEIMPSSIQPADFIFSVSSGVEIAQGGSTAVLAGSTADAVGVSDDKKTVTLQFANAVMTPNVIYKVSIPSGAITDAEGNAITSTDNSAVFLASSTINSAPKVDSVVCLNNQTLQVNFSKPISLLLRDTGDSGDTIFTGADFTITPGTNSPAWTGSFSRAILSPDKKSLTLYFKSILISKDTDKFADGSSYIFTIKNNNKIHDLLGVMDLSYTGTDAQGIFTGVSSQAASPKISSISAVDENTIDIIFNQRINSKLSSTNSNDITVAVNSTGTAFDAVDVMVRPEGSDGNKLRVFFNNSSPFVPGTVYKIILDNTKLFNENNMVMDKADNSAIFQATATKNAIPKIDSVLTINSENKIKVIFSEKITNVAPDGSDFIIFDGKIDSAAVDETDVTGKSVILKLHNTLTNGLKTLELSPSSHIKDEAGIFNVDITSKLDFAYNNNSIIAPFDTNDIDIIDVEGETNDIFAIKSTSRTQSLRGGDIITFTAGTKVAKYVISTSDETQLAQGVLKLTVADLTAVSGTLYGFDAAIIKNSIVSVVVGNPTGNKSIGLAEMVQ